MGISGAMLFFALVLTIIAGFINGSFATPTKYMGKWKDETIWFTFSFYGMLILPWLTIFILAPNILSILGNANFYPSLLTLIIGGLVFGLGQICFAVAFKLIGLGLNFVVNISIGTACTALVGLIQNPNLFGTSYSYLQILGVIIFIVAVILGSAAGAARDKNKQSVVDKKNTDNKSHVKNGFVVLGVILAIGAGIGSAFQGASYVLGNPAIVELAKASGAGGLTSNTIAWVIIFSCAFVPYVIYFLILNIKNKSFGGYSESGTAKYWFFLLLMGIGFWGSLILFSGANSIIGGKLGPTIAWPLFMVFIILTSNFWGMVTGEWKGAGSKAVNKIWISIFLFIFAIIVFSCSVLLKPAENVLPAKTAQIEQQVLSQSHNS
jgi:L-rhamnose-H+ transport protein